MFRSFLLISFLLCGLVSCSEQGRQSNATEKVRTDGLGRRVMIPVKIRKVMGLSPAITEMLFALLPDSAIAAVSMQCNYPPAKVLLKPRLNTFPLDLEKLLMLKPDLILTETGISSPADVARMEKAGLNVYVFHYQKVVDILNAMDSIRTWINPAPESRYLMDSLKRETRRLEDRSRKLSKNNRPSLLAITWSDPIFAYGQDTWMSDKMRLAGGKNALDKALDKPYPQISREYILKMNPDVIFGGDFGKMDSSFFRLYPELKMTKAYRSQSVFGLDDDLASRPGPRFLNGILEIEQKLTSVKRL